jgi:hypothetical protein
VAVFTGRGVAVEVGVATTVAELIAVVADSSAVEVGPAVMVAVTDEMLSSVTGEAGNGVSAKIGVRAAKAISCSTGPPPTPSTVLFDVAAPVVSAPGHGTPIPRACGVTVAVRTAVAVGRPASGVKETAVV